MVNQKEIEKQVENERLMQEIGEIEFYLNEIKEIKDRIAK